MEIAGPGLRLGQIARDIGGRVERDFGRLETPVCVIKSDDGIFLLPTAIRG